ncbi:PqiC family protein [Oleisolibacter albus]|uniref:PqiC family protein n=1 Tax=Oleisolibacter albus TaxID=2171757 RepID=UPI000DF2D9CC|nr:PqiC family protein [Oleisolibacter albus]
MIRLSHVLSSARACLLLMLLAGCSSAAPTLLALPPAPAPQTAAADGISLLLRPVRVPGYLDSLGMVTRRDGGQVGLAAGTEWAERLGDGSTRVLAGALSDRLGPGRLLIEGDGRIPDADLSVEILRMDPLPDGRLLLEARWTLVGSQGERPSRAATSRVEIPMTNATPAGVAEATSAALGQLADDLAAAAAAFPRSAIERRT